MTGKEFIRLTAEQQAGEQSAQTGAGKGIPGEMTPKRQNEQNTC